MLSFTENPYLDKRPKWKEYDLNVYLFSEFVIEKTVDSVTMVKTVRNLLSILGFDVRLIGHRFLTRLVALYVTSDGEFDLDGRIEFITKFYDTYLDFVQDNIRAVIAENKRFERKAQKLLRRRIPDDIRLDIEQTVYIVSAIFKKFYNYVLDADTLNDIEPNVNPLKRLVESL